MYTNQKVNTLRYRIRKKQEELDKIQKSELFREAKSILSMSDSRRIEIDKAWDIYYGKSRESASYWLWEKMRDAFQRGDLVAIKAFKEEAHQLLLRGNFLKPPGVIDPSVVLQKAQYLMIAHQGIMKEIEAMQRKIEELQTVESMSDE